MNDDPWAAARRRMVEEQIRRRGIRDPAVLAAMEAVPRHLFVPEAVRAAAYRDHAMAIGEGQTISQPYMVAVMTEALEVAPEHKVLEIGTGSGYQGAVLAHLAAEVFTIERIPSLAREAAATFAALGLRNVRTRVGDGSLGWPEEAPFQRILVTAAAPSLPPALLGQLDPDGGILVAPVGERHIQDAVRARRISDRYESEVLLGCRFVPLVGAEGWPEGEDAPSP